MSSKVQICNSALSLLGVDEPIISLTENKKEARLCNTNFDMVRDDCLRTHYWNFALKRKELGKSSTPPLFDFSNAFQLPNDVILVRKINGDAQEPFKIEGGLLLCDLDSVEIQYVSKETDVSLYDPAFKEALAYKLAAKIAYALVQSVSLMDRLGQLADRKLQNARSLDGIADVSDDLIDDIFLDSRRGKHGSFRGIDTDV